MSKKNRRDKNAAPKVKRQEIPFVERPFEGIPAESHLVAMREILPLATLTVKTNAEYGNAEVTLATILPQMSAGMRREDGAALVALQTIMSSGDASRDVANSILLTLDLEDGQALQLSDLPEPGPRLQDILDLDSFGEIELHDEPTFWMSPEEAAKPQNQEALKQAREQLIPTKEVPGQEGAYWCRMSREFLRWVRPEPRDAVLDALARLRSTGDEAFVDAKFVGAFRAQGLSIPVWELDRGTEADELEKPLADFLPKFEAALSSTEPLTPEQKRARAGIVSRQVTLR
ncbi:topoisomerase II [Arcanobacterium haemolyticum]|nr:topoisomerase II [Arcanobacterium haemolyticum]